MPAEKPSGKKRRESQLSEKWFVHKSSRNKFRVTRLHDLHAEILNADGTVGLVNLDLLLHDIEAGLYETEPVRKGG